MISRRIHRRSRRSIQKTVALIELGDSHVDCIYSQLLFLREGGYTTHLICSERLRDRVRSFDNVHRLVSLDHGDDVKGHWRCILRIRRYLKDNDIRMVIFNTGGGSHTRDLCLVAPRGTRLVGIIHHIHKLRGSFTQFLISLRLRKYFVLNDYLLDGIPHSPRRTFESVYLIFREPLQEMTVRKDPEELWVAIPGEVDFRRRAYTALVEEMMNRGRLDGSVRFVLLGECKREGDGEVLRQAISKGDMQRHFMVFDHFLNPSSFVGYLRHCDLLLPIIEPNTDFFAHYRQYQISGTYNLAFGYGIPMLLHSALRGPDDFELSAYFYDTGGLIPLLNHLAANREEYRAKANHIKTAGKFSFAVQCEKYLRFLET